MTFKIPSCGQCGQQLVLDGLTFRCSSHHPVKKPPLGIMPRWRWLEARMEALTEAIDRYRAQGIDPRWEWVQERNALAPTIQAEHAFRNMIESEPLVTMPWDPPT